LRRAGVDICAIRTLRITTVSVHTGCSNAAVSIGNFRERLPVAAKIALVTAGTSPAGLLRGEIENCFHKVPFRKLRLSRFYMQLADVRSATFFCWSNWSGESHGPSAPSPPQLNWSELRAFSGRTIARGGWRLLHRGRIGPGSFLGRLLRTVERRLLSARPAPN
jgi:hypothetical protein